MGEKLTDKLARVEENIRTARAELPALDEARKEARAALESTDGDVNAESPEYKELVDAMAAYGEKEDYITAETAKQVTLLKVSGGDNEALAAGREMARQEAMQAAGIGGKNSTAWDARAHLADPDVRARLERASTQRKVKMGTPIELGEVVTRDALAADVTGTTQMRTGAYRGIMPQIFRPLRVLDLLPTGTMDNESFWYTQEGGSFLAAETPEGQLKPEDGVTFTDAEASAQTIAAWQKIRKQSLSDFAALQSTISNRLRYSVMRRLENQALNGNGTGGNLEGILETTGIGNVAFDATKPLAELILTGITNVFLADAEANGIVMNPVDWQGALTQKALYTASGTGANAVTGGSGEYIGGGPFSITPQVMWGVPLLASPAIPQGTALVGDFAIGAELLIREGVNVLFSDSDQDDFLRNRVTLLGEMRAALPVYRPVAFQEVALKSS